MSTEDNKRLVRRLYEETDKQNFASLDEFFSAELIDHDPPPIPNLKPGLEGIKQAFKVFATAFLDGTHVIHDLIAEGDRVVVRVSGTGTHKGEFKGIPPTGKPVEMAGIVIYRIEGGKIVERWAQHNFLGFVMQQLGVVSLPGHEPHPHPDQREPSVPAKPNDKLSRRPPSFPKM